MRELLKNPFFVFFAGLVLLWLLFSLLKIFMSFFGLIVLAFVVLYALNGTFRKIVQSFFRRIFR